MKKIFTLKTILLAFMCVMGVGSAWAESVTFTFKTDADITYTASGTSGGGAACDVTKSNVRLEGSNAYTASTKTLSCYANSTLKITAPGNITQIDLSYNGQVYPFDEAPGDDGSANNKFSAKGAHAASYTPATPAKSITLNNTNNGKTELLTLTVTYTSGAIVNVTGVSLDITSKTIMVDENFKLTPTVSPDNATNKAVNWSTSDASVATVNGGTVLGVKAGTATITATTANGSKTATCTVTVNPKSAPEGAVFFETFDQFDGDGGVDGTWSNITTTKALGTFDNTGWTTEGSVLSGYKCASIRKVDSTTPSGLTTPAIGATGDGSIQFKAESWGTDGSNFFVDIVGGGTFVADDNLVEGNISNNGTTAKVTLTKTGNFTTYNLQFTGLTATSKFRFYAPANKRAFLDEVAVIGTAATSEPTSYELTIPEYCYATFYDVEHNYIMPDDCKGYILKQDYDEDIQRTMCFFEVAYEAGDNVPANMPLVIYSETPGTKTLEFTDEPARWVWDNQLFGTDEEIDKTPQEGLNYYHLQNGAKGPGLYKSEDATFHVGAHEAYMIKTEGDDPASHYLLKGREYVEVTFNSACTDDDYYYGTFSSSKPLYVRSGVYVAEVAVDDGELVVEEYETGSIIPANTGVMISSYEDGTYNLMVAEGMEEYAESVLGEDNCLKPSGDNGITAAQMAEADANCLYYRLTMHNGTQIGFWWGAAEGAAFSLAANKAYLAVPNGSSAKTSFWLDDNSTTTSLNNVNVNAENGAAYNLAGQRVKANTKGIVIMNGKKYVNK